MEWNKKVKPGQVPKMDKGETKWNSPKNQSTVSHLLTDELANSSKKRKVESISSSLTGSGDSSDQEPSSISTSSTLAEVLIQLEGLQKLVKIQGELITKLTKSTKMSTTPQNACVGEVKSVIQTVGKKVLGLCKTGNMVGRLFRALKGEDGKLVRGSYDWLAKEVKLKDVAQKVSGIKEREDGSKKYWSSWRDNESGEFVLGCYKEKEMESSDEE